MKSADDGCDAVDPPALWASLQDLEDGSIAEDRRDALMEQLARSPEARREYFEYFHQVAVLRMEADKMNERGGLASVRPLSGPRAWWARPWLAAAAVLLAAFLGVMVFRPAQRSAVADVPSVQARAVGGSLWQINGIPQPDTGKEVVIRAGDSLRVTSGMVKLELDSGSVIVMQGGSHAGFPAPRKPVLYEGWLWIDTGNTNDAFEISTQELVIRDIGTRFGVRIAEGGQSEIHLLEGSVNVISQESGIKLATLAHDGKGRNVHADGSLEELPLAEDPFPMMHSRLHGISHYGNAVLAQKPKCYWTFDAGIDGRFDNAVHGGRTAKSGPSVGLASGGRGSPFAGFSSYNQSLYFPADEKSSWASSVVAFLDGGKGVSRRQGAVTFWIRGEERTKEEQVLWLVGRPHPVKPGPTEALAHTFLAASGHLGFVMSSGSQEWSIRSDRSIAPGSWHHIGLSWSETDMDLYLNGERVAHQDGVPGREEWFSHGNSVRFGKPTDDLYRKGMRSFHGCLDECALWDRPLTPVEVARQFQAARGGSAD